MTNTTGRAALLVSTSLVAAGLSTAAFAQAPKPNANALEEVVVTATRQTSTVNKVALSVSAVTQKSLDQQGIRSMADLAQQVPGFTFRTTGFDNNPQLTLRGIGGNAIGGTSGSAPTTGVYIDDVPLQKRNANSLETGSGTPVPLLYDLDRVEVLRGPQGTLYGGSSEGGTLRFITPQPSLTTYTGSARVGVSTMTNGSMGNEEGVALGGPLIRDKVGFRVSAFRQDRPGWVNGYSEYDGHQFATAVNKGSDYSLNGKLLFQFTPSFKATLAVINQMNYDQDNPTIRSSSGATVVALRTLVHTGTLNGVRYSFPATTYGGFTIPAQTWLSGLNGNTNGEYLTPTNVQYLPSPRRTIFTTPSLTLDYNLNDKFDFKSITSYTSDRTGGYTYQGGAGMRASVLPNLANQACPSGVGQTTPILQGASTCSILPQYIQINGTQGPANQNSYYIFNNRRGQVTQEFRVSTIDPSSRLQFVAGVYVMHEKNHVNVGSNYNEIYFAQQIHGIPEAYPTGGGTLVPLLETPGNPVIDISTRNVNIVEDELSGFADATFAVTDKLKITAGVRATSYTQQYSQIYGGDLAGPPSGFVGTSDTGAIETNPNSLTPFPTNFAACPTNPADGAKNPGTYAVAGCPYQYTAGVLKEHPVTPKMGASYQLNASDMLYVTYAEGQRPGGINPPLPAAGCGGDIALLGGQPPSTYTHDTVKSTEVGGKFRLFDGQMQLNAAAFHIDWQNVQFIVPLIFCSLSYVANAGAAVSNGAELQVTGRAYGFTLNSNIAYDDAHYTSAVLGPVPPAGSGKVQAVLANKGDNLGIPDWTISVGLQYDWHTFELPTYARMDYDYAGKYARGTSAGTTSFSAVASPNTVNGEPTNQINARVGVYYKSLEIAAYVKNAANEQQWVNKTEASGTQYLAGIRETPRIVGMQMNYRF